MYSPPKGTLFHCIYECFKYGHFYVWLSERPGRPTTCNSCYSLTYDSFPDNTTKRDVILHGCEECLKLWNTLYYSDNERFISKQDIIEIYLSTEDKNIQQGIVNMWNKAHPHRKGQIRRAALRDLTTEETTDDISL